MLHTEDPNAGSAQTSLLAVSLLLSLLQVPLNLVHPIGDLPFFRFALSHVVALVLHTQALAYVLQGRLWATLSDKEREPTPKEEKLLRSSLTFSFLFSFSFNATMIGWPLLCSALGAAFQTLWTQMLFRLLLVCHRRGMDWQRYGRLVGLGVVCGGLAAYVWELVLPAHMEYGLLYLLLYVLSLAHYLRLNKALQAPFPANFESLPSLEVSSVPLFPRISKTNSEAAANYDWLLTSAQAMKAAKGLRS